MLTGERDASWRSVARAAAAVLRVLEQGLPYMALFFIVPLPPPPPADPVAVPLDRRSCAPPTETELQLWAQFHRRDRQWWSRWFARQEDTR